MVAPWELVAHLTLKVERAKKHILDLEAAWDAFYQSGAYEISVNRDTNMGNYFYYLSSAKDIPQEFSLIAGDAIQNLRSALDHLAYHLVCVGKKSLGPFSYVYFPIFKDASKYKSMSPRKVQGMRQDAIDAIGDIEPYGGGAGEILWHLNCLSKIDKHRLLLTVWSDLGGHNPLPSQYVELARQNPNTGKGSFIPPTVRHFPLKTGDVLLVVPESEMQENMNFILRVAFGEPEIVKGKAIIPTLHEMTNRIRRIVFRFDGLGLL